MKRNIGIVVATLLAFSCGRAVGDGYPSKTVRVINQFGAGGGQISPHVPFSRSFKPRWAVLSLWTTSRAAAV